MRLNFGSLLRPGTVLAACGIGLLGLAVPAQAATTASTEGCPSGYVCLYPSTNWNGGVPSQKWLTYGYHNLTNVTGYHRFFNNQTGGASAYTCSGYNGTGTELGGVHATLWTDANFTPVNSVVLDASGNFPKYC